MPDVAHKLAWAAFILSVVLGVAAVWATPTTLDTRLGGTAFIALVVAAVLVLVAWNEDDA